MILEKKEITIIFQPEGKRIKIFAGLTILDAALKGGIDLIAICGGNHTCGKCKIFIENQSTINPLTNEEKEKLTDEEIKKGIRLACLVKPKNNVTVRIPEFSRTGRQRLQIEGIETPIQLNPTIKKVYLELDEPTLEDPKSDFDRIHDKLEKMLDIDGIMIEYDLLKDLSITIRDLDWKFTVVLCNNKIIGIEPQNTLEKIYGYAVDIGTTKLAGYLVNLGDGKVIAAGSLMNPQIPYGEDIIARLSYKDLNKLNNILINALNDILNDLLNRTGIKNSEVYEMTAVGNTVMHHLFLNIGPKYLGYAPYPPVVTRSLVVDSKKIGMMLNSNAKVFILPTIAGFVGADTIGVILSTEIYKRKEICLVIDIGTNTEVVLGNKDRMITCSCASGPAFEGAHVRHGMRASSGSIEEIGIDPKSLEITYKTIDNALPVGICGSGMIDLVAEMLKSGIINMRGNFNKGLNHPRIREGNNGYELVVVPSEKNGINEDIVFTQNDIRQITLAKAAMQTGIRMLMKEFGIDKDEIQNVFLAGAFGSHINKKSARVIGIYPEIDLDLVKIVGNAAGTGARMCLASSEAKKLVNEISKKVEYIELASRKDFQKEFLNCSFFPYSDLSEYPIFSEILKENGNFPEKLLRKF